jgi:hypothetical protein
MNARAIKQLRISAVLLSLAGAVGLAQTPGTGFPNLPRDQDIKVSKLGYRLLLETNDFRCEFFATKSSFETFRQDGLVLVLYGSAITSRRVASTKDSPTVKAVLDKCGLSRTTVQVRVVQQNRILQTPAPRKGDEDAVNAVLDMRVQPGDVLIVTMKE